jgi:hypothetical protein
MGHTDRVGRVGGGGGVRPASNGGAGQAALVAIVLVHLAVSILHGQAHSGGHVGLSLASALFVYIVIVAGPLVGLVVLRWRPDGGAWIIAASLGGALVFGLFNHFIIAGADRVDHVPAEWRTWFETTAVLLLVTEAVGTVVATLAALRLARRVS